MNRWLDQLRAPEVSYPPCCLRLWPSLGSRSKYQIRGSDSGFLVLFAGLLAGRWGSSWRRRAASRATAGLIIFVYTIGCKSGPASSSLAQTGLAPQFMVAAIVFLGAAVALLIGWFGHFDCANYGDLCGRDDEHARTRSNARSAQSAGEPSSARLPFSSALATPWRIHVAYGYHRSDAGIGEPPSK